MALVELSVVEQRYRAVLEARPENEVAAGKGQAVTHDRDEHRGIDVAPGEQCQRRTLAAGLARD